jgi:hypothetical protein
VFTVNTANISTGGDKVFTLTVTEAGKTPVIFTITVTIGYIQTLYFDSLPTKTVYLQGENLDLSGMVLAGKYSDGSDLSEPAGNYTITGFDSSSTGDKTVQISIRGRIASNKTGNYNMPDSPPGSIPITVKTPDAREIYFDYGIRRSSADTQPNRYSVPQGRTLVLAPVKWYIPDTASYEWKVDGAVQGSTTEYFSFTPATQGDYAVTVTVKIGGSAVSTAATTVACVAPEGTYKRNRTGTSQVKATQVVSGFMAPGQYAVKPTVGVDLYSLGGYGGYTIRKFDHSVEKTGVGRKELKIDGNAFSGWVEAGAVWVMQDENGNGLPDDTWYELAGSETLKPETRRRYTVTYNRTTNSWIDNLGGGAEIGHLQSVGYRSDWPAEMTFTGTCLTRGYSDPNAWRGYVDVMGDQCFNLSDAIQVDGSPVNLTYIDFVKIQTAENIYSSTFGETSTEYKTPVDNSMPNPAMLLSGTSASGQYNYKFINNSGYPLNITVGSAPEFVLNPGATETVPLPVSTAYFSYNGGNADFTKSGGTVTFVDG